MTLKARITAIDRFVKGCREDGIYDDLNACCVMAGWDSLAGALTPLKGAAPTNNGFIATDYDRGGIGITGDGTSYIDSGRANGDDPQNDKHAAVYRAASGSGQRADFGAGVVSAGTFAHFTDAAGQEYFACATNNYDTVSGANDETGTLAISRSNATEFSARAGALSQTFLRTSQSLFAGNVWIFARNNSGSPNSVSNATLAFYSIGSSLGSDPATGLAALDARVSTLMADLRAIEETGFDRDALAYIRAVEEADGAYLETDVKVAINNLVSGLKADSLWDAIGSSCLLCGPRTLSGALVPLKGNAPTNVANGFVSGDYARGGATPGLTGDGTSYIDSGRSANADLKSDAHMAAFLTAIPSGGQRFIGAYSGIGTADDFLDTSGGLRCRSVNTSSVFAPTAGTLFGVSRNGDTSFVVRVDENDVPGLAGTAVAPGTANYFIFAQNDNGTPFLRTTATIAFYSIGQDIGTPGLVALESHVSSYVTAIGAAI